jgi:tetratricopeptide (TPR) repeat protein
LALLNRKVDAEDQFLVAIEGFTETLGETHILTLNTNNHLAVLLRNCGELAEAEEILNKTLTSLQAKRLSSAYNNTKHHDDSATNNSKGPSEATVIDDTVDEKRELDMSIGEAAYNYGILCIQLQNRARAAELFKQAHESLLKVLGPSHPFTQDALYWKDRAHEESLRELDLIKASNVPARSSADGSNISSNQTSSAVVLDRSQHGYDADHNSQDLLAHRLSTSVTNSATTFRSRQLWISATFCEMCNLEYTVINREHHCRMCLRSVCSKCSPYRAHIMDSGVVKRARICVDCDRQGFR